MRWEVGKLYANRNKNFGVWLVTGVSFGDSLIAHCLGRRQQTKSEHVCRYQDDDWFEVTSENLTDKQKLEVVKWLTMSD